VAPAEGFAPRGSANHDYDPELLERARENHVLAYLVKPIKGEDLQPAITVVMSRFQEFRSLRQEAANLRQALQDRKVIKRAKGILMKRGNLDEATAFQRLQKLARDNSRKLVEVAEMIVTAEQAFEPSQ
jgi:response regulator NasT